MEEWKKEIKKHNKKITKEIQKNNEEILTIPDNLSVEEKIVYNEVISKFRKSIRYRLSHSDVELIWQYCQLKIMRDRAWKEYNKNQERYIRIVTGLSHDGQTPKITVKENEHYKTLIDCNKQLERILKDLRLTPEIRFKKII